MSSRALRKVNFRDGEGHAVARGPLLHIPLLDPGDTLTSESEVFALFIQMVADSYSWPVKKLYDAIGAELGVCSNPTLDSKVRRLREDMNEALQQLERADVE